MHGLDDLKTEASFVMIEALTSNMLSLEEGKPKWSGEPFAKKLWAVLDKAYAEGIKDGKKTR